MIVLLGGRITFRESDHTYWDGPREIPGVSHIISSVRGEGFYAPGEWHKKKGTFVHRAVALWCAGTLYESSLDPTVLAYLECWKKVAADLKLSTFQTEQVVYHPGLDYIGTLDMICSVDKCYRIVLDLKTGAKGKNHRAQLGAYILATEDEALLYEPSCIAYLREGKPYSLDWLEPSDTMAAVNEFRGILAEYRKKEETIEW